MFTINIFKYSHLFRNKIFLFTVFRYCVFFVLFVRGVLVAKYLGPFLFGIFGILSLLQQYLLYTGLGLNFAINVELSTNKHASTDFHEKQISSSLMLTAIMSGVLILLGTGIQMLDLALFSKYSFNKYAMLVGFIAGFNLLQQVMTNVYRFFGNLARIAFVEALSATVLLFIALSFRGENLVYALLLGMATLGVIGLAVYAVRAPFNIKFNLDPLFAKRLISLGLPLLIYNASFYLITICAQTVISIYYPIEIMGYYTLAGNITGAILLGLNSVTWVVFPEILSKTSYAVGDTEVVETIQKVNALYGTAVFLLVFTVIICLPVLFFFLPQFKPVQDTLNILLLSQAVLALSFGYNCVAIARNKHITVAKISLVTVLFVTVICLIAAYSKLHYDWIAMSVLFGSFLFTILQTRTSSKIIPNGKQHRSNLKDILPLGSILSITCFLIGRLTEHQCIFGIAGLILFVLTNKNKVVQLGLFCSQKVKK